MEAYWKTVTDLVHEFQFFGIENTIDFVKFNLYSLVHHSTGIEGCTLSESESHLLLEKGITSGGKPLEHSMMVKDCYNALLFIIEESRKKTKLTPEFLKTIYQLSFDVHFNLVSIHPWADGNGRTCRLVMNYYQLMHLLPL
ncbi:MAG: Fic family protein, partial [Bacteroidetes bacterium]|nr:Fic family protein [Bacteroidota bacterium]